MTTIKFTLKSMLFALGFLFASQSAAQHFNIESAATVKVLSDTYMHITNDVTVENGGLLDIAGFVTISGTLTSADNVLLCI
jgi:hypothetical protein